MLDAKIADEILEAWTTVAGLRNRPEMVQSVPDRRELLALLEIAFLASIEREERAPIRPRLVFFPGTTPIHAQTRVSGLHELRFSEPVPLSVRSLAKLAPAFDQDSSAFAVVKDGDGRYLLVGALFYGRMMTMLESGQGSRGRPYVLTLSVRAPGSVAIAFGDSVVGRYERGQLVLADPGPMASTFFINHVIGTISRHQAYRNHEMDYWFLYRDCLERLYLGVSRFGHGGTVVWCPSTQLAVAAATLRPSTQVTIGTSGHKLADIVLRHRKTAETDPDLGPVAADSTRHLAEYLDFVARLATVDGALLVDDEIVPHHFRGQIAARWSGRVVEANARGQHPKEIDISSFGTRHTSAIALVGQYPGIVSFVVSEDGPVRAMMRIDQDVVIWPDCLNTVFLD